MQVNTHWTDLRSTADISLIYIEQVKKWKNLMIIQVTVSIYNIPRVKIEKEEVNSHHHRDLIHLHPGYCINEYK